MILLHVTDTFPARAESIQPAGDLAEMSKVEKMRIALERASAELPADTRQRLLDTLRPETLQSILVLAGTVAAGHLIGLGEAMDVTLLIYLGITGGAKALEVVYGIGASLAEAASANDVGELDRAVDTLRYSLSDGGASLLLAMLGQRAAKAGGNGMNLPPAVAALPGGGTFVVPGLAEAATASASTGRIGLAAGTMGSDPAEQTTMRMSNPEGSSANGPDRSGVDTSELKPQELAKRYRGLPDEAKQSGSLSEWARQTLQNPDPEMARLSLRMANFGVRQGGDYMTLYCAAKQMWQLARADLENGPRLNLLVQRLMRAVTADDVAAAQAAAAEIREIASAVNASLGDGRAAKSLLRIEGLQIKDFIKLLTTDEGFRRIAPEMVDFFSDQ